jgi:pimeloyl-ACP methyl ester carboxylesterase
MPFFEASDGTHLFYMDWGNGKPAMFSHAWALNADMWDYQIPDLVDAGHRCITFDRRGHGRSDRPTTGYDYDTFANDLAALIAHLDLEEAALVGYSSGCGEITRYLARHGRDRVDRVVFGAPLMPLIAKRDDNPEGVDPSYVEASAAALKRDVPGWCADNAAPYFGTAELVSPGMADWVTRQIVATPLKVLLDTLRLGTETDHREQLAKIEVPTMVVHGTHDASAPIDLTGRKTATLVPECELVVYQNAGHGLYAAQAARFNADLIAFLKS